MQNLYQFQTAERIIAGENSFQKAADHISLLGTDIKNILLVTQPSMKRLGFADELKNQLTNKGIHVDVNIQIQPEPTLENIEEVFSEVSKNSYDIVVGLGGGSILDSTKILSVLMTNDCSIESILGTDLVQHPGIPTVLIPTTSGTGAEVTPNAIVTLPDKELKIGVVSKHLYPKLVIMDPVLTVSLPKEITAATGMDAFTHSLESFISNKANPISDMFALESIRLISSSILEAYQQGDSVRARENMLIGSMYGGMALSSAGTAAVHALAYPLGGKYKITHGVANSMLLPHVMEFNMDAVVHRLSLVAEPMGIITLGMSKEQAAAKVVEKIKSWTYHLNIPQDLKEYGVKDKNLEELAYSASQVTRLLNNNPKTVEMKDMKMIYKKLLA
ncbi:iron-containing alcohol dehydrogenase [Metabacillus arenae]|uniref:Iron-containing alcohol dehydrogenase n=1 Tax=Metabacillus arenae TaxID=2771434 RepID=A0A926S357_9BACI|nr:iron-containing alcohol dehydrogenase [Metabacillus arenae]MBD1382639.1 iron-containing alcohol dehydrogenase [Metabacillus arenae]